MRFVVLCLEDNAFWENGFWFAFEGKYVLVKTACGAVVKRQCVWVKAICGKNANAVLSGFLCPKP